METELDVPHRSSHMSAVRAVDTAYSTLANTRRHSAVHAVDEAYSTLDPNTRHSAVRAVDATYSTLDTKVALYASLDLVLQPFSPVLLDLVLQPYSPTLCVLIPACSAGERRWRWQRRCRG